MKIPKGVLRVSLILLFTALAFPVFADEVTGRGSGTESFESSQDASDTVPACFAQPSPDLILSQSQDIPLSPPVQDQRQPVSSSPPPSLTAEKAAPGWQWRRADAVEYAVTAAAAIGAAIVDEHQPSKAQWTSHNGFDETFRDLLRLEDQSARSAAYTAGDVLMGAMIAAPELDTFATLGLRDRRWDEVWQTNFINLESFVFSALVSAGLQNIIARERPFVRNCANGGCEFGLQNRSMPSGHSAFAFTGAGLVCTHHHYLALYQDDTADTAACYAGLGVASADSILRLMADGHYMSDVLAGTAIGLFSGFVLPRLLHYSWPTAPQESAEKNRLLSRVTLRPRFLPGGATVGCDIAF